MHEPFIQNHHYNLIKKQVDVLQRACNTVSDHKVVESVRYSAQSKIIEAFPDAAEHQKEMLEKIATLHTAEEFQQYLDSLEPYRTSFPQVTGKQIAKLFPKIKKLKTPDLDTVDYRHVTYLGWSDIASNRLFLVYPLNGQTVGIEGRYTPANKGVCFLCNRMEDVALFTTIAKSKPANASPDYYKAIGNYMCMNSEVCNKNITDITALEKFIQEAAGQPKA